MSRRLRVEPAPASRAPADEAVEIDVDDGQQEPVGGAGAAGVSVHARVIRRLASGISVVEAVADGWRFELEVEDADRAALRRRATRDRDAGAASGPTEIRAIIPGRVAAVRVVAGDPVDAGASLLVVEAMKMQNELRAPRAGVVERVAVGEGQTIEPGDVLVVLR